MTQPRRAQRWTLTRRLADKWFPRVFPGNHHLVWEVKETAK